MQKLTHRICVVGFTLIVAACTTTPSQTQRPPGFLPNYDLLKPVASPEGTQIYVYKNPDVKRSDYNAAIVEPVSLYETASKSGVTNQQIEKARANINAGIQQIVSRKIPLTNVAGPGVFRLQVAITGASFQPDGFKPWNVIPISAAIKLASMAAGVDGKKPVLMVELKFVDSQTGTLLKEVVTQISGEEFRTNGNASQQFATLATDWVQQALKYAN